MADNFVTNAATTTGVTFASDELAGLVQIPLIKVAFGANGVMTMVDGSNGLPVSGPLTDTQLRATAVPVTLASTTISGSVAVTGTFWQATQPVSASSLPLPAGAATETTLAAISTKTPALGQATMAASQPVVIASDQSALSVTKLDATATGTITAINGNVAVSCAGKGTVTIQTEGTYTATGGLTPQARVNATGAWVTLSGASTLLSNAGVYSATIASAAQGIYQLDVSGFTEFRLIALGAVTGTLTVNVRATDAVALTALDMSLPAGTAIIGALSANQSTNVAQMNGVAPLMGNGVSGTGALRVVLASDPTTPTTIPFPVPTAYVLNAAAGTNATSIKASSGRIFNLLLCNSTSGAGSFTRYVKIYNKASAPTVGTDVPRLTIAIKVDEIQRICLGPTGSFFSLGIAIAITADATDAGSGGIAAGDIKVQMDYI